MKALKKFNILIATLSIFIYGFLRFKIYFTPPFSPKGDETGFLEVFKIFISDGYSVANIYGNSSLFNAISFPFYLLVNNELLSLRLTSLLSGLLTIIIVAVLFKNYFKLTKLRFLVGLLTALNVLVVSNYMFVGINDSLIYLLTVLFFLLVFKIQHEKLESLINYVFLGIVLGFLLSTRPMAILLFIPMILVILITFRKLNIQFGSFLKLSFVIIFSFVLTTLTINYPSIKENVSLSFHSKEPKGSTNVNWVQLQYLSAMGQDSGDIKRNKNYTWKQVEDYLAINGENSLPKTAFSSLFWDFKLTIKEFFIDFFLLIIPFTRLVGLVFPLSIFFFFLRLKDRNSLSQILKNEIIIFFLVYCAIISFVVITNVEPRLLVSILVLVPLAIFNSIPKKFHFGGKELIIEPYVIHFQLISLTLMNSLYIYKVLS